MSAETTGKLMVPGTGHWFRSAGTGWGKVSHRMSSPAYQGFTTISAGHVCAPCPKFWAQNQETMRSVPETAPRGWVSGKSWGDIVIKAPAGGCVCWQQHSCIANVWECWEWEIFCRKNPAWAKVQKEERGCRSSLAADPPGEHLSSKPEATEQSVQCNNQTPRDKNRSISGDGSTKMMLPWNKRTKFDLSRIFLAQYKE